MKRRFVGLAILALVIAAGTLAYHGPGRALIRGHVGDGAATMLVYAVLGLAWRTRARNRALATLAFATAIELGQGVWHVHSLAGDLLVGNTFDGWDFVAYVIGIAVAVAWERRPLAEAAAPVSPA
ncbi:MAG: DUF2809 domain-containing protein [Kofleriaceae bacterium]